MGSDKNGMRLKHQEQKKLFTFVFILFFLVMFCGLHFALIKKYVINALNIKKITIYNRKVKIDYWSKYVLAC